MQSAAASCLELLSLALYNLNLSLPTSGSVPTPQALIVFKTNLCATVAYIDTCLDGFEHELDEKLRNAVIASLDSSRKNVSNSLSILSDHNLGSSSRKPRNYAWPPSWMSLEERKLLAGSIKTTAADVVVAKDGSGKFKTISEAIKSAPQSSEKRFVIYVKQGKYEEHEIRTSQFYVSSHTRIYHGSAVYGRGFIAKDMGFENTAGASSGQAVALLSSSEKSVLYKCKIDGYQDTVFSVSGHQFYRECSISGTIDFIFGRSSAVFQKCSILVRKPAQGQVNIITAQGKYGMQCPSGFSIHKSNVVAAEDLDGVRTFLGRPWRNYATTVFMESFLGGLIDPEGWSGREIGTSPSDTVYYGEYGNTGPGSATAVRVSSKGVRVKMSDEEAKNFTVGEFIGGAEWLPATGVPFEPGL
ncbi:hypothetical protein ACS0TY_010669 [Phlomoides rotata]